MTYSDAIVKRLTVLCTEKNITIIRLNMMVSELLAFPEMNETLFDDE